MIEQLYSMTTIHSGRKCNYSLKKRVVTMSMDQVKKIHAQVSLTVSCTVKEVYAYVLSHEIGHSLQHHEWGSKWLSHQSTSNLYNVEKDAWIRALYLVEQLPGYDATVFTAVMNTALETYNV